MKKRNYLIVRVIVYSLLSFNFQLFTFNSLAQSGGVAINSTGGAADNSAMLDISSINQGMRIPRVALTSTTSAYPISNPANSLLVYDSVTTADVTPGFYYWDGTDSKWIRFSTGSGNGWSTSGNAGTDTATNFIGTTDDKSWVMKTNNTQRMKISKSGNVGIGNTNPASSAILDVNSTTKGVLISRMTSLQRDAIVSPSTGLQIFNIDCNMNEYYTGSCWVSMGKSLPNPGIITSNPPATNFCAGDSRTYSISAIPSATSYIWSVPAGATINSGNGTTSISVTFGSISGNVCVSANNACETSGQTCIPVNLNLPTTPGSINGSSSVNPNQTSVNYFIIAVPGATSYTWTVPSGASIVSGQGTASIVVNYVCNASSGAISVTATSACGTSSASSLAVIVNSLVANIPATVGGGVVVTCNPSGGTSPYTYSWSPTSNLSNSGVSNPTALCSGTTTTYTVTVTDAKSCTATNSVVVSRLVADAGGDRSLACGTQPFIGGSPTASQGTAPYTYLWSPSAYLSSGTTPNPSATGGYTYTVTVTDINNCTSTSSMTLTITGGPSGSTTATFTYTGSSQTWAVPAGVTCVKMEAWGAEGGNSYSGAAAGKGGYIYGNKTVTSGSILTINVGGKGGNGTQTVGGSGGWNGGGNNTGSYSNTYSGGGGGGASDVRYGGTDYANRIVVGGGGGAGAYTSNVGGDGGYPSGGNGGYCCSSPESAGIGGTQTSGNALGVGGSLGGGNTCGGAGGGGYYGGTSGSSNCNSGGGGGGSSFYGSTDSNRGYTNATWSGNGKVVITY